MVYSISEGTNSSISQDAVKVRQLRQRTSSQVDFVKANTPKDSMPNYQVKVSETGSEGVGSGIDTSNK